MNFLMQIKEAGVNGFLITAVGILCVGLIIERLKALYFTYNLKTGPFMSRIQSLILEDKIEDAITLCSQYEKKPLAKTIKTILQRADRDEDALFQAQDIGLSENVPLLGRRIGFLMMLSNVATLFGLLGTIQGLIVAFSAVSQADPAVKQTMLAEGISVSMYTTAIGLTIAIPTMMIYAFLNAKQQAMSEEIIEQSTRVIELLTSRQYREINKEAVFPTNAAQGRFEAMVVTPPPTNLRVA